jgi:hypothetical protein
MGAATTSTEAGTATTGTGKASTGADHDYIWSGNNNHDENREFQGSVLIIQDDNADKIIPDDYVDRGTIIFEFT